MANARSIVNQNFYQQLETTPGVAARNAMKRYLGLRVTSMGWNMQKEYFTGAGAKAPSAGAILTELGALTVEASQDYNGLMPLLAGVFGKPVTTPDPVNVGVFTHVFSINAYEPDDIASHTVVYGDATQAIEATNVVYHGMNLGVTRTALSLSANTILRAPETGATIPASGVVDVPLVPARASTYAAYLDSTWAALRTTKLLSLYSTQLAFGDKYGPDWVVDNALESFSQLLENEDVSMTQALTLGFDATAVAQIEDAKNGMPKFVRIDATGPEIADTGQPHKLTIDTCVDLTPGNVTRSSVSPATVIDFAGRLIVDAESGNIAQVTLVNGLASL